MEKKQEKKDNRKRDVKVAPTGQDLKRGVDFIGVTVSFYCHDGKGRVLLQKRSKLCRDEQGRWDCGGGALEFGETWEDGARREIREEYGVDAKDLKLVRIHNVLRDNNGIQTHWISIVFAAKINPEDVVIGEPHKIDEIGWFTLDTLPEPLHSILPEGLKHVEELIFLKRGS